ncbi:MAG: prohibitin family protein [Candidatus Obscuribacterales bacterium]|nr:prohibitin family protein [Candidatus Obscuribacterales bacterium]
MKNLSRIVLCLAGLAFASLMFKWTCTTCVDDGNVGVVKTFGSISETELSPGFHLVWPWQSVTHMTNQIKGYALDTTSQSKDLQRISTQITVQHSLEPGKAYLVLTSVGTLEQLDTRIIGPAVQESLKAVIAHYSAEDLVKRRKEMKEHMVREIQEFISETLAKKGLQGAVTIHGVAVTDFDFSPEFNKSIEAKVKAEQDALRAENEKVRRSTEAEAKAIEEKRKSDGQAYETEAVSKARAAAITREAEALKLNSDALIQLRNIEKWNGKLPTYNGSSTVPFIGDKSATPAPTK